MALATLLLPILLLLVPATPTRACLVSYNCSAWPDLAQLRSDACTTFLRCAGGALGHTHIPADLGDAWLEAGGIAAEIELRGAALGGALPASLGELQDLLFLQLEDTLVWDASALNTSRMGQLQVLSITDSRLNGSFPVALLEATSSTAVCREWLDDAPEAFSPIEDFSVSGNRLTGPVPAEIGKLQCAVRIDLSNNALSGRVPDGVFMQQFTPETGLNANKSLEITTFSDRLRELRLDSNQLTSISPHLTLLPAGARVYLGNNPLVCDCRLLHWFGQWADTSGQLADWNSVRCSAANSLQGTVAASVRIDRRSPCFAPSTPHAEAAGATWLAVGWTHPNETQWQDNRNLVHFKLTIHLRGDASSALQELIVPAGNSSLVIPNLAPYTQYEVHVTPFHLFYDGLSEALFLDYNPPSPWHQLDGYGLTVDEMLTRLENNDQDLIDSLSLQLTFAGLTVGQVLARTLQVEGIASSAAFFWTLPTAPDTVPRNPKLLRNDSVSFTVGWEAPAVRASRGDLVPSCGGWPDRRPDAAEPVRVSGDKPTHRVRHGPQRHVQCPRAGRLQLRCGPVQRALPRAHWGVLPARFLSQPQARVRAMRGRVLRGLAWQRSVPRMSRGAAQNQRSRLALGGRLRGGGGILQDGGGRAGGLP